MGFLWIRFDVFSQFAMQFIFLSIAGALGMVLPRYKGVVAFALAAGLILIYGYWPHYESRNLPLIQASAKDQQLLKVASFNTFAGNTNLDEIKSAIEKMNPDVMTLVEFGKAKLPLLDELKASYPYQVNCLKDSECNFAIISKFPLRNPQSRAGWAGPPFMSAQLGPEFNDLTVMAVHTTRFPYTRAQFTQVKELVKYAETIASPLLMMGDFNSTPFSRVNQTVADGLDLQRLTYLPTWPSTVDLPQLAIDHIFVSQGMRAVSAEVIGDSSGSDHYPISMTIALPKP